MLRTLDDYVVFICPTCGWEGEPTRNDHESIGHLSYWAHYDDTHIPPPIKKTLRSVLIDGQMTDSSGQVTE